MIYIDPPYNTTNGDFVYNDTRTYKLDDLINAGMSEDEAKRVLEFSSRKSSSHSAWLTFMYPRLFLARKLLKDDGVIFISIDDNEAAHLKLLCDGIFGEENFVAQVVWECRNPNVDIVSTDHEYCFVYAKNKNELKPVYKKNRGEYVNLKNYNWLGRNITREYNQKDEKGNFRYVDIGTVTPRQAHYTYYINIDSLQGYECDYQSIETLDKTKFVGHKYYAMPLKNCLNKINKGELLIVKNAKGEYSIKEKRYQHEESQYAALPSVVKRKEIKYDDSNDDLKALKMHFSFAKPVEYIKNFVLSATNKNDIIMDFFAGSGTTGHAVMQLNAEDGGNRKFILVQLDERITPKNKDSKELYDFAKNELKREPTIYEITRERLLRAGKKISHDYANATNLEFSEFSIVPKDELELEKLEKLDLSLSDDLFINFDDSKTNEILTSYKLADGIALDVEFKTVFLNEYKAYYSNKLLYLVYPYFTSENTKVLMQKLQNKDLICERVILYNASFKSSEHKTLKDALNQIGVKLQVRF